MSPSEEHPSPQANAPAASGDSARLATPPSPAPAPSENLTGTYFAARYAIERCLGGGPVGQVYVARRDDGSAVALKVLVPKHRTDPNVVRRFMRAAEGARALDHPSILRVLDHGVHEGVPFVCSELSAGLPLNQALAGTPLTLRRVLAPLCDVLSALAEAHRQGILHRCLKPSNVLLEQRADGTSVTQVCDFDLGRLLKPVPGTARTKHGASCGAAEYMAPEQALTTEIDGRADVYAVGVMLYELLTGQVPFHGTRAEEVLAKHQNDEVIAPRTLRRDRAIPREVESICLRALAKKPVDRYQSPREMSSAIRAILELFGPRADLALEEPEGPLDTSAHTVSKDRFTMPGEQLRSRQKVGLGAALLISVCGVIWLSAPHESGDRPTARSPAVSLEPRPVASRASARLSATDDPLTRGRALLDAGEALAALKELEAAQARFGESAGFKRLLGEALIKVGQREPGRAHLRRYLSETPEAPDRAAVEDLLAEP